MAKASPLINYCARCATLCGARPAAPTTDFLASAYQRDKHVKHTVAAPSHTAQSIFDNATPEYYQATLMEAYLRGAVQVSSKGTDLLFCPSTQSSLGFKQAYGSYIGPQDTVRVVQTGNTIKVHAFLNASSDHSGNTCSNCGGPLFVAP